MIYTPGEVHTFIVDCNDPEIQNTATLLTEMLVKHTGIDALAIALVVTQKMCNAVLRMESPMQEGNAQQIERLLDGLKTTVLGDVSTQEQKVH